MNVWYINRTVATNIEIVCDTVCHKNSKLDVKTDRFYETLENDEKYDFENIMMFAEKIKQYKLQFHDFLLDLKNQDCHLIFR